MKKFLITLFLISMLQAILGYFLPWWILAVICFLVGLVAHVSYGQSFLAGFLGITLNWLIVILYLDLPNHHLLSIKLSHLFGLQGNYDAFIVLNAMLGGLLGGMSCMVGRMFGSTEKRKPV